VLGALDLGWSTAALLVVPLCGLALPMAYGAYVWFTQDLPAERVPPRG
jgi:hypothetical protein